MNFDIFYGVDGTGVDDDDAYADEFRTSFVKSFVDCNVWGWSSYERGPKLMGHSTEERGNRVFTQVRMAYGAVPPSRTPRIFLSGYSRGGAAVIQAARMLGASGIPVHALMLFDAVDRAPNIQVNWTLPTNVRRAFHALRHPNAFSRPYFGNCGTAWDPRSTDCKLRLFFGTHGALGGVPWKPAPGQPLNDKIREGLNTDGSVAAPTNVTFLQDQTAHRLVGQWSQNEFQGMRS